MTIAVISDIHGNLEALNAVLADIEQHRVESVYCLGDVVGYGPEPSACLERTRAVCDFILMGNHEYYALGLISPEHLSPVARQSALWTQGNLTEDDLELVSNFDMESTLADIHLVHASPFEPQRWRYILESGEARRAFDSFDGRICFFGHSHLPSIFSTSEEGGIRQQVGHDFQPMDDKRYLVNVGSIGQPRDNDPRASYVTYNLDSQDIRFHRVEYDIEKTQEKMKQAGLPRLLIDRLKVGQ